MKALCWLRRELRSYDNRILTEAHRIADSIYAAYIFDKDTMNSRGMSFNDPRAKLVLEALIDLNRKIPIHVLYGSFQETLHNLINSNKFDYLITSEPLSWEEEKLVSIAKTICKNYGIAFHTISDNTLANLNRINGVRNFSEFYKIWKNNIESTVIPETPSHKFRRLPEKDAKEFCKENKIELHENFWNLEFLKNRLKNFNFESYGQCRDFPHLDCSSKLSPYISNGIISIRQLYNETKNRSEEFIRQLAWREYYYYLKIKYPDMNRIELKKIPNIEWENDKYLLQAFLEAKTGYPLVDAGVRQLKLEFWIHNRVRLVVANFLTKVLHIDWRIGEKIFREKLIDFDEPLNVGNWQWCASVGVDPLPFRYFNPILQMKKYDPLCQYVKKYIPELGNLKAEDICNPESLKMHGYYEPIVDYSERMKEYKNKLFQKNI